MDVPFDFRREVTSAVPLETALLAQFITPEMAQLLQAGVAVRPLPHYEPLGHGAPVTKLEYRADGQVRESSQWVDNQRVSGTRYLYDALARPQVVLEAAGITDPLTQRSAERRTVTRRDAAGNVRLVIDTNGLQTGYDYDALNRHLAVCVGLGQVTEPRATYTWYDAADNLRLQADAVSLHKTSYDALNRRIETWNAVVPNDPHRFFGYDINSQLRATWQNQDVKWVGVPEQRDAIYHHLQYRYDALDRPIELEQGAYQGAALPYRDPQAPEPHNRLTRWRYYADGSLYESTDRNGRRRRFEVDGLGRVTGEEWLGVVGETASTRFRFVYNAADLRMKSQRWEAGQADPGANATTPGDLDIFRSYDDLGRLRSERRGVGTFFNYSYIFGTAWSQVRLEENLHGNRSQTESRYDAAGRLLSRTLVEYQQTVQRPRLEVRQEYRGDQVTTLQYLPRLGGDWRSVQIGYDYSRLGQVRDIKQGAVPAALANGPGDAPGTQLTSEHFHYTYDDAGRLATETRQSYTGHYRWVAYRHLLAGASDRWEPETDPEFSSTVPHPYDLASQLQRTSTIGYDRTGNEANPYHYLLWGNRLGSNREWNFGYDSEGNTTRKLKIEFAANQPNHWEHHSVVTPLQEWQYEYDHHNRLLQAQYLAGSSSATAEYRYDAEGNLVERTAWGQQASQTVRFVIHQGHEVAELNQDNQVLRRYVRGDNTDQLWARVDATPVRGEPNSVLWYITDRLGSVAALINSGGALAQRIKYNGFGAPHVVASEPGDVTDRWGYTGRWTDAMTGFQNNRARWYDASTGRWISQDPIRADLTNTYRYVGNSPTNATDPSGLIAAGAWAGLTAGGVVASQAGSWLWNNALAPAISSADAVLGHVRTGWWAQVSHASAGVGDTVSFNLTRFARRGLGFDDVVDHNSTAYRYGTYAGQAINIGLMLANPAALASRFLTTGLGTWYKQALLRVNMASMTGGVLSAGEALRNGDPTLAAMQLAGAGLSWLRGAGTFCQTRAGWGAAAAWGQWGLQGVGVAMSANSAWDRFQKGEYLGAALDLVQGAVGVRKMLQPCFAAGTKLLWEGGYKKIEQFVAGERVWARDENDPESPLELKVVEEVFVRFGKITHLHLEGGKLIRTTAEHPFYEYNKGWVAVEVLQPGDLIRTDVGWVAVEEVYDTGEYETVYNLRVAEWHTYFVGEESWGWSVWAHNACYSIKDARRDVAELVEASIPGARRLAAILEQNHQKSQLAGYRFQVMRAHRYFKRGELHSVEFKTHPGNQNSPRVDIRLRDGLRIEAKSWRGWKPQNALQNLAAAGATKAKKQLYQQLAQDLQNKQTKQLNTLKKEVHEYLRTPGTRLRVEFDRKTPAEVRALLQQL